MKSEKEMKTRYYMYKTIHTIGRFVGIPFTVIFNFRNKTNMSPKEEFYLWWLFDIFEQPAKASMLEWYANNHYIVVVVDDTFILHVWTANKPYADMDFRIFRKEKGDDSQIMMIGDDNMKNPSAFVARKMRNVFNMVDTADKDGIPFDGIHGRLIRSNPVTTELLKEIIIAKELEAL